MGMIRRSGLVVLVSGVAFAQPPPPPPPGGAVVTEAPVSETQSVLPNLLSTAAGPTIDLRTDFTIDAESDESLTLFATNMHAQFISPTGLGGYASVPFVYASADGESENGIGNLEVGGLYVVRQPSGTDILLRGGVAIDTSSQEDLVILAAAHLSPRITDLYTSGFDTTWGRVQAQARHAEGNLRIGGSIGFDLPIDGLAAESDVFDGAITAAAAIGVHGPSVGFGLGFGLVKVITDADSDDTTFTSINATIDFPIGAKARFFGAFGYPEPDENELEIYSVGVGVRAGI